jgi:transposase
MKDPSWTDPKAQERVLLILQVQAGTITASQAAKQLGISRKTYYQWEQRALSAMLDAATQLPPGRPRKHTSPTERRLEQKVWILQKQIDKAEESKEIRAILDIVRRRQQEQDAKKNRTP